MADAIMPAKGGRFVKLFVLVPSFLQMVVMGAERAVSGSVIAFGEIVKCIKLMPSTQI